MTSISFTRSNPTVSLNTSVENDKNAKDLYSAKVTLAEELKRLYPDGVMKTSSDSPLNFYNSSLEHIINNGTLRDENGELQPVSQEVRNAAKTILDNGGAAAISPSKGTWFTEDDLRKSIANDPAMNPVEKFQDFLNKQRSNKV